MKTSNSGRFKREKLLRMIFFRKSKERLNMLLQVLKTAIKTITITTIKAIITTILIIVIIHKAVLKTKLHKIKMQLRFIPTIQTVYRQSKSLFKAVHIRLMRILTIQQPKTTAHQARRQTARLMNIIILPFRCLRQMAKFLRLKFRITKMSNSHQTKIRI